MNDDRFSLSLCIAVGLLANVALWLILFRLGQALHYFIFG